MLSSTAEVPNCQALDEWFPRVPLLSGLKRCLGTSVLQVASVWLARCRVVVRLVKAHKRHSRADVKAQPWICASKWMKRCATLNEKEMMKDERGMTNEEDAHDVLSRETGQTCWTDNRLDGEGSVGMGIGYARAASGRPVVGGKHSSGYFVPTFSVWT